MSIQTDGRTDGQTEFLIVNGALNYVARPKTGTMLTGFICNVETNSTESFRRDAVLRHRVAY